MDLKADGVPDDTGVANEGEGGSCGGNVASKCERLRWWSGLIGRRECGGHEAWHVGVVTFRIQVKVRLADGAKLHDVGCHILQDASLG